MDISDVVSKIEPNSRKYHEEQEIREARRPKKVINGVVRKKRPSLVDRFKATIIKESPENVRKYIIQDVIIPRLIDGVYDILTGAYDMTFRGDVGRRPGRSTTNSLGSKINYVGFYPNNDRGGRPANTKRTDVARSFDNIYFESKGEAELVLDNMVEILNSQYKQVTVADLYDLVGVDGEFTDNDFGWRDLSGAKVRHSSDGYYIDLPRCIPVK